MIDLLNYSRAVEIVDAQHLASIIDDAVTYDYHICDILRRSKYGLPGGATHQRKDLSKAFHRLVSLYCFRVNVNTCLYNIMQKEMCQR